MLSLYQVGRLAMADLVTIAHFPSTASAQVARNVLANAGITAVMNSAMGLNAYYGNWMQGVQLQVDEVDAERATYLLEAQQKLEEGEDVEGLDDTEADDAGMHFDDVEKEAPLPPMEFTSAGQQHSDDSEDNPYTSPSVVALATPQAEELEDEDDQDSEEDREDVENDAVRMFRGAVICLFIPFIAPAVTWQLLGRLDQYSLLSSHGKSRVVWAWIISLPVTVFMIGGFLFFAYAALGPR